MFIPLEATALKSNFWSAAAKGMKEVKKHSKNLEILNPRNHWAIYTPLAQDDVSLKTAKKSKTKDQEN